MIYFDSSAVVTAVLGREYAPALRRYLELHAGRPWTSTIGFVEVVRTCDLVGDYPGLLDALSDDYDEAPLTRVVRDRAASLPGRLRALDAIHVASAQILGPELVALVTYDRRMADAARSVGLPVAMPGLD